MGIARDISRGEATEKELDNLITKRHEKRMSGEQGRIEDGWAESVRTHNAKRREALCWAWLRFHTQQLRNHQTTAALIARHHEQEIRKYEEMLGINYEREESA